MVISISSLVTDLIYHYNSDYDYAYKNYWYYYYYYCGLNKANVVLLDFVVLVVVVKVVST